MKKDFKNLSCPNCQSSNITIRRKNIQPEDAKNSQEESTIKTEPIIYECTCQDCNKKFEVHQGYRTYFTCCHPIPIDEDKNIHLLATYQSDSPLENDYKLISIKETDQKHLIYLLLMKNNNYPIEVSQELINEIVEEPPKVFSLIKKKQ